MKRKIGTIGLLVIIFSLVLMGCNAQKTDNQEQEPSAVPIEVAAVEQGSLSGKEMITGKTEAKVDVSVTPQASGELVSILVEKGQKVEKGQLLAKLDDTNARLALQQARAGLSKAQSSLEQAITSRKNNMETTQAALEQAESAWENAKAQLERMKSLYETGAVSLKQYEDAIQAEKQAHSAYKQAKVQAETADDEENIQSLRATVAEATAAVEQAEQSLNNTVIHAPVSGEVAQINADVGETVSMQAPLFRVVQLQPMLVKTSITAEQLAAFHVGDQVGVNIPALGKDVAGTVHYVSAAADEAGKFELEVLLNNEDQTLRAGMVAQVVLEKHQVDNALIVPTAAVVEDGDETYVYVVRDNKAVQVPVEVQLTQTERSAVKGELEAGEQVVVKGQLILNDGDAVNVVEGGE